MKRLRIRSSEGDQIIDLTDRVQTAFAECAGTPQTNCAGAVLISVAHTTCAVTTMDLDPGTDLDFLNALRHILPDLRYRHPHDPQHTPDHILASLIGPSVLIPFENGKLLLGTWQRIVLIELDGPRERTLNLTFLIEAA